MRSVAPPRRLPWPPPARELLRLLRRLLLRLLVLVLRRFGVSASSLLAVMAARGGLDGGDGRPEVGTSGIPLGPWCHGQPSPMIYRGSFFLGRAGTERAREKGMDGRSIPVRLVVQ